MVRKVLDSDNVYGIKVKLIKDNDEYKFLRQEGKYKHVENWGKITEDEAFNKYYRSKEI